MSIFSLLLLITIIISACGKTENLGSSVDSSSSGSTTGGGDSSQTAFTSGYGGVDKNGEKATEAVQRLVEDTGNDIYDRLIISIEEVYNCSLCDRDLAVKTISEAHSGVIAEKEIYGYAKVSVYNRVKLLQDCDLGNAGDVYDRQETFYMVMPDKDSPWEVMDHTIDFPLTGVKEISEINFASVYGGTDKNSKSAADVVQGLLEDDNSGLYDRSKAEVGEVEYCFVADEDIVMNRSMAESRFRIEREKGISGYAVVLARYKLKVLQDSVYGSAGKTVDELRQFSMVMTDGNSAWEIYDWGAIPFDFDRAYERYISKKEK